MNTQSSFELIGSRGFTDWLTRERVSIGFTTYQAGKLFLLGVKPDGRLAANERTFARCMGLWTNPQAQTLWMASQFQLWRFENMLPPGSDRLYVPQLGYTTGDIDTHDVAIDADGSVVFVNTLFSCLATVSDRYSFEPLWQPAFISKLAAEDRCHLNGLAMQEGRPRYVTACSQSDVVDGWRDQRADGGCVVDIKSGEIVTEGLSMPHSPRLYRDRLWLLDSGTGHFGCVDFKTGKLERVTFCPGYARGLSFVGDYAVVGVSKPREQTFTGLPLDGNLTDRRAVSRCGLQVIDLNTGDVVHWLRIEGVVAELYDVAVLPGVSRPRALGFKSDDIRRNVWFEDEGKPSAWTAGE